MSDFEQEHRASAAFSKQAPVFDRIDEENALIVWMRERIHRQTMRHLKPGDRLLELNCGTGIDALFFASNGVRVHATDNAPGMLEQLSRKVEKAGLEDLITIQRCSFNSLEQIGTTPAFDHVFSDFGGLNCTDRLDLVLAGIDRLLKPGGKFTLVIMPPVCPWELAMLLRGKVRTAFRRLRKGGTMANVENMPFRCYYYDPGYVMRNAGKGYRLLSLKGLAVTVPPPYIEHFVERHPQLFRILERWEERLADKAPFNRWCDHFIITMEKK